MRRITGGVIVVLAVSLVVGPARAFQCPKLQKAAAESIVKAEGVVAKITDAKAKAAAQAMVNLAKELNRASEDSHAKGSDARDANLHYRSEAEAKAAKALAEMASRM